MSQAVTSHDYDVTTFVKNYLGMSAGDDGTTDEGNPQPVLVASGFAYDPPIDGKKLPIDFYVAANKAFAQLNKNLVAFPTEMFEVLDVCVMDKDLFLGVLTKEIEDGEASLSIENADKAALSRIREELDHVGGGNESDE